MEKRITDFIKTVEKSWNAPIGMSSYDTSDLYYIKFKLTTESKELNKRLFSTISSINKLKGLQYHSIALAQDKTYIEVTLSKKFTGFEENLSLYL